MACNVFPGMIYYVESFLCYTRLKLMSSDIFRTGKTSNIFTFEDTKAWGGLTPIASSTCWGHTSDFLMSSYYGITLEETQEPS